MLTTSRRVLRQIRALSTDFSAESRALSRRVFWRVARRFTPTLTVDRDGMRLTVSTYDHIIGRRLFVNRHIPEEDIQRAFAGLRAIPSVAPTLAGASVVEIGANIGSHTVEMLTRFGAGSVVAIEPHPENCSLLRQNVVVNGVADDVQVLELALSDTEGVVQLEVSGFNSGDHHVRIGGEPTTGGGPETIDVRCVTLDSLVEDGTIDIAATDLIWMDAQGHEAHILDGATKHLLGSDIPILMEYWPFGLRRAAGLERLHALIAEHYTHVIDLYPPGGGPPRVLAADQLDGLEAANGWVGASVSEPSGTDLILTTAIDANWRMTDLAADAAR